MNAMKYDSDITALLVIDPYNDFLSEGGKIWDRLRSVGRGQQLHSSYDGGPDCGAAGAASRVLCAASSLPPRRLRDLEVHRASAEGRVVAKGLRVRHVGWRDSQRIRTATGRYRALETGARAASPTRTWTSSSRGTASRGSSSSGSSHTPASRRRFASPRNLATTSRWSGTRPRTIRMKRCTPRSTSTSQTTPVPS